MVANKRILIMDNDARETIDMDTEKIVNWMAQGKDTPMFEKAFSACDAVDLAAINDNIIGLEVVLRCIDDTVRVKAVPATVECVCGYSWTPRVAEPKSCPRCKRRLD